MPAAAAPPLPPRPAPLPPRSAPPPLPPSKPAQQSSGRRTFVKLAFLAGAVLSIIPFVPWGQYLSSTIRTGSAQQTLVQKVVVDDLPSKYGAAAGQTANINDLVTFPPNDHWVITYPTSGDPTVDAENPDTFQKFELIRLPKELGGDSKKASDFVAYSKVCVHLWCSPNYNPTQSIDPTENGYQPGASNHMQYECPCHGSIYQLPQKDASGNLVDGGKAIAGPASLQAFPQNAIPLLTLQADANGDLWIFLPNADPTKTTVSNGTANIVSLDPIEADGTIGYGRDYASYQNFILPAAKIPLDPKDEGVPIT
ncbi:MAG: Rieske 2Fe-2S domain-containing protein [Nitrososphaerota archaeon]|nr:Rieske 2Fe-2S domain-containing protein [Nitrososphaerota archaeon]